MASRDGRTRISSVPARMADILPCTTALLTEPEEAGRLLRQGALVAFPTETVWGLGADATCADAVARIFAAKDRPRFNPLICHLPDAESAFTHGIADDRARALAAAFWPGPLTMVLRRNPDSPVSLLASAGQETLALRVPALDLARRMLVAAGCPVAAPSANRSGRVSPTSRDHVMEGLAGRIDAVLDGPDCMVGVESTVIDLSGPSAILLRPGGVSREALRDVIGDVTVLSAPEGGADGSREQVLLSPGMMRSHYAPSLTVRLDAVSVAADEALLAFGPPLPGAGLVWNLSAAGDVIEAATRLFSGLRTLDSEGRQRGLRGIACMRVPMQGLGEAINDRLARAAAPREMPSDAVGEP
ncbi:Sua5/YciO/YrdC/YwlC family protein [Granulibacter bethesdensis CGDNIH4]|nr:Sua5/YciO/YrdC/YwlC family protein [Granulibacter bethesdensis CGDNIH4]